MDRLQTKWHETQLRVRYSETDAMQVVYHGNYLNWFEIGRTEMMRRAGIPYREMEGKGILLPVIEARAFYHAPARYDDQIVVRTSLVEPQVKVKFEYEILRAADRQLLVDGYTVHAWVNQQMKPVLLRKVLPEMDKKIMQWFRG